MMMRIVKEQYQLVILSVLYKSGIEKVECYCIYQWEKVT